MAATSEEMLNQIAKVRAEVRAKVGERATNLSRVREKVRALPHTAEGLAKEFDLSAKDAAAALQRLQMIESALDSELQTLNERICLLDRAMRIHNSTDMEWKARAAQIKSLMDAATTDPVANGQGWGPMEYFSNLSQVGFGRNEKYALHDAFASGWGKVTAAYTRFLGSMTGGSDIITVSFGMNDQGKKASTPERVAAFLSLAGGALLSDAGTTHHLRNIVTDGASRAARQKAKQALRDAAKKKAPDAPDAPSTPQVATSQTSTLPSGTVADIEAMGIPVENFNKIQQRCLEQNAQVMVRPSGVETPHQLRQGATPKAMHHKSKTANDYDTLLGVDPKMNGCCAAYEPKTDFFETAMRKAGMSEGDIAANLDKIKAGQMPDAPPGFADNGVWAGAVKRFQFRDGEWKGPIGDAVRKRVKNGESEIKDGIVYDIVNGEKAPVAGDHDIFETFHNGRASTPEEAEAFWKGLNEENAGVMHGGHARFDPKPEDYLPGGRFEVDTTGYSPDAAAAKIKAKYESDRQIYEVIIDKHSSQGLPDDVLRNMEGFEPPVRGHYPEGAYGDLRYKADAELYDRWEFMRSGKAGPLPERPPAEVLVLINPYGPPLMVRAGDVPANYQGPIRPLEMTPAAPGSDVRLPMGLAFWGVNGMMQQPVEWDDGVGQWFGRFGELTDEAAPICADCEPTAIIAGGFPWKRAGAAAAAAIVIGGGVGVVALGGGDDEAAPATTVAIALPAETVAETVPPTTAPPSTVPDATAPPSTAPDPTVPPSTVPEPPGPATSYFMANPCGVTFHVPAIDFPGSPSHFLRVDHVVGVDGDIEPGTPVQYTIDVADLPVVDTVVDERGIATALVPISSYGSYAVGVTVDGEPPLGESTLVLEIDANEGPVGGCVPASEQSDDELASTVTRVRGELTPGDDGGDPDVDDADAGDPQGQTVPVNGPAIEIPDSFPPPEDDLGPYREFFTRYETAHREGDTEFLLEKLHPATIGRYGVAECAAYIESIVGSVSGLRVVEGMTEPWDYPGDGLTTEIPDAFTLTIDGEFGGVRQTVEIHVARVGDDFAWFADCGTAPQASG